MNNGLRVIWIILFVVVLVGTISAQTRYGITNRDGVTMRRCAGLHCKPILRLRKGAKCKILNVEDLDEVDGYGYNAWLEVSIDGKKGFIYSPLLLIEQISEKDEIAVNVPGQVRDKSVNVRFCPDLNCPILFELPESGYYCRVLSKTQEQENINRLGTHPWYFIEFGQKQGYVFGGLIDLISDNVIGQLSIIDGKIVQLFDRPGGNVIAQAKPGLTYDIFERSAKSEVVRPYGRHYWYRIKFDDQQSAWIFGALTSEKTTPVDCQCVDYVKNSLGITGPTKNAFEWDQVLQGMIQVKAHGVKRSLSYQEITDMADIKTGDIAVFDTQHPDVNDQYGHVGFVHQIETTKTGKLLVNIEGGNQKGQDVQFFEDMGCHNVSRKWYEVTDAVRFFRAEL